MTWTLIVANVLVFLIQLADGQRVGLTTSGIDHVLLRFGLDVPDVAHHQYYRLITSAFLHFGLLHVGLNMFSLYIVGPSLEQVLGRWRFLTVYLLSAVGGSVLAYMIVSVNAVVAGASGAIFGLFGAMFVVYKRLRLDPRPISFLIIVNLIFSFTVAGIAWQGHVGGLVTGAAVTAAFVYAPRPSRLAVQLGATAAVVVLLIVLVAVRTSQLSGRFG